MNYAIRLKGYGYYDGHSEKYHDMININIFGGIKTAKRYPEEQAKK